MFAYDFSFFIFYPELSDFLVSCQVIHLLQSLLILSYSWSFLGVLLFTFLSDFKDKHCVFLTYGSLDNHLNFWISDMAIFSFQIHVWASIATVLCTFPFWWLITPLSWPSVQISHISWALPQSKGNNSFSTVIAFLT